MYAKSRRTWRKLHLAVDADSGMIVAQVLTDQHTDDPSQVGPLLDQVEEKNGKVTADGAYDGTPTYQTIARYGDNIETVIPPRCQSAPHSFQFSACGISQRAAYNLARHQHDWQRLMLIAGKNSALIDTLGSAPCARSESLKASRSADGNFGGLWFNPLT